MKPGVLQWGNVGGVNAIMDVVEVALSMGMYTYSENVITL